MSLLPFRRQCLSKRAATQKLYIRCQNRYDSNGLFLVLWCFSIYGASKRICLLLPVSYLMLELIPYLVARASVVASDKDLNETQVFCRRP